MPRSGRPQANPIICKVSHQERATWRQLCLRRNSNSNRELAKLLRAELEKAAHNGELVDGNTRGNGDMLEIAPGVPSYALGALPTKEGKSPVERQQIEDRIREKDAASRSVVRNNKPGFR